MWAAIFLTSAFRPQAYITGSAFTILTGPETLVQTIYAVTEDALEAIDIDEESGRIATCTRTVLSVYKPCVSGRGTSPKVCTDPW